LGICIKAQPFLVIDAVLSGNRQWLGEPGSLSTVVLANVSAGRAPLGKLGIGQCGAWRSR
jgi:hypothetical protein